MVEVGSRDVDQLSGLLLDGRDHLGVAVAGRSHGNAGCKVEKLVAVHIFHANAASALGNQRIGARITGRDQPCVRRNGFLRLGAWQGTNKFRSVLRVQLFLSHRQSPKESLNMLIFEGFGP